jgi:hypothetical protein
MEPTGLALLRTEEFGRPGRPEPDSGLGMLMTEEGADEETADCAANRRRTCSQPWMKYRGSEGGSPKVSLSNGLLKFRGLHATVMASQHIRIYSRKQGARYYSHSLSMIPCL